MKKIFAEFARKLGLSFAVVFLVAVCMYHSSCQITPEGITLVGDGATSVRITDYNIDAGTIEVKFSKDVSVSKAFAVESDESKTSIENFLETEQKMTVDFNNEADKKDVVFEVKDKTQIGKCYALFASVKDPAGNSLSFTIPFYGENKNFPVVVISEISDNYEKAKHKVEFIELYCVTSGNFFGLELYTASDERSFRLPCVEVSKGEYVVVHLRKTDEEGMCISELGDNLNLSTATGSVSGARDIWIDSEESALSGTAEIVLLKNKARSVIVDCVMYCTRDYQEENSNWKSEKLINIAELCKQNSLWGGNCLPQDAVWSTERKSTSFISRTDCARLTGTVTPTSRTNWKCHTATSSTPGRPNS
ncbi:MAG: hypothetical protein KBS84_03165 [Treponema sp.]|nr:hypothetical protein [Candidatus Treponema scatequi]